MQQSHVKAYDAAFMADSAAWAERNVAVVLPIVVTEVGTLPSTVIDVGCGPGGWVLELVKAGVDATGMDGAWAAPNLVIPPERFVAWNLEQSLPRDRRYAMAVTIETAEHLSPERGPSFVAELCALSDVVLFSASVPGTPGTHHVNLRWQSYWIDQFQAVGFGVVDCIRPALWDVVPAVSWPLAQQCFLFVKDAKPRLSLPANVVHPACYELQAFPRLRKMVSDLPQAVRRFGRVRLSRLRSMSRLTGR